MSTNTKIAYWLHDRAAEMIDGDDDAFPDALRALVKRLLLEEKATSAEPAERKPVAGWEVGHVPGYSARRAAPILRRGPICVRATEIGWEMIAESDEDGVESIQITSESAASLEAAQLAAEDALRAIADQINGVLRGGQP